MTDTADPHPAVPGDDALFSTEYLTETANSPNPVVVVGLPRSGSSFASHLLSNLPNYYVFDDLYLIRRAKEIKADLRLTPNQLNKLLFFLGWQIRSRLKLATYAVPNVALDEVEPMNDALRTALANRDITVFDLQREWLFRLAKRSGADRWGFKMPSAFVLLDDLRTAYPDLKVIYNMRDPNDVLASYKFMPKTSFDGDPRQYHPLFYAFYWRKAVNSYLEQVGRDPESVKLMLFEGMVRDPLAQAQGIAEFLDVAPPASVTVPERPNSSHSKKRKTITGLETLLVNVICRKQMSALGYTPRKEPVKLSDVLDLLKTTLTFIHFRAVALPAKVRKRTKVAAQNS